MNPYELGTRKLIPAVLVYAYRKKNGSLEYLMLLRNKKQNDIHEGKWSGLGGKCDPGESFSEAAIRETKEESGLELKKDLLQCHGVLLFPNFKPDRNEDWQVTIFSTELESSTAAPECTEGTLSWIPANEVLKLNLWEGDKIFLDQLLKGNSILGTFWYENGKLARHEIQNFSSRSMNR